MRSKRHDSEHQEAVSRRLALLSAELAAVREPEAAEPDPDEPWRAPPTHTRVRPDRLAALEVPGPPESEPPAAVPEPGRHARRRGWAPRGLPGPVAIGPGQLTVVGLAILVGLVVTTWWLVRAGPHEVGPATAPPATAATAAPLVTGLPAAGRPTPVPSSGAAELVVDVAGKVRRPGIAVLAPGSRVVDALEAAGGVRPGVDLTALNLARTLVDGEQILVGVGPATGVAAGALASPASPAAPGPAGALVPLNSAGQAELESLPEVGPVTAAAIIAWRDAHGGFTAVDELLEVDGIGEATLGQLAPLVTL